MKTTVTLLVLGTLIVTSQASAQDAIRRVGSCRTLSSGSYILTRNILANGDCFILIGDDITLDLNGFTIVGNGTGSAVRTDGPTKNRFTIKNGAIRNFQSGVALQTTVAFVLAERLSVIGVRAAGGVGIGANESSIVRYNIVSMNGVGIAVGSRSVVTNNTATFNTDGFNIGSGSTIIGNTSGSNRRDGFQTQIGVTVINNTAFANGRWGFLRNGGNFIGNTAFLSGGEDVAGQANNAVNNFPPP